MIYGAVESEVMSHRGIEKEVVFFPNKTLFGYLTVNTKLGCEREIPFLNN